jgi:hypothetical protein
MSNKHDNTQHVYDDRGNRYEADPKDLTPDPKPDGGPLGNLLEIPATIIDTVVNRR